MYDLAILGGGPAGYLAAERASAGGMKVALFERRSLGGVCLNEGCIPTKALLSSAKVFEYASQGAGYGVMAENVALDHAAAIRRKNNAVKALVSGVKAKMKANGVDVFSANGTALGKIDAGFAIGTSPSACAPPNAGAPPCASAPHLAASPSHANAPRSVSSGVCEAARLLVATGSAPIVLPIPGVRESLASGFALTSREILDIAQAPKRLVVVGGGVIGLEMASYFAATGSQVTVVEMLDNIAGPTESEVSRVLQANLQRKGIAFRLGSKVTRVDEDYGVDVEGVCDGSAAGNRQTRREKLAADRVLLCIGRSPSFEGSGLERLGVHTERGAIATDRNLRTNIPNIYAAGDVNGISMLAHTAYREAEVATNHMLGRADSMRYDAIPFVIYTSPEVGGVGETERSAKAKGYAAVAKKLPLRFSGRYVAELPYVYGGPGGGGSGGIGGIGGPGGGGSGGIGGPGGGGSGGIGGPGGGVSGGIGGPGGGGSGIGGPGGGVSGGIGGTGGDGICKLVVDQASRRLIGAHVIGSYASEIILSAAIMVESRYPLRALKEFVFPHPTVGEIIRDTLFEFDIDFDSNIRKE